MKKISLIAAALALVLGASYAIAANTSWHGSYWGDPTGVAFQGTWKGTVYDDPTGTPPYFEGEWVSDDATLGSGTLYAYLASATPGVYSVTSGVIYDMDGVETGVWDGYFDATTRQGDAEGTWETFDTAYFGYWQGKLNLAGE